MGADFLPWAINPQLMVGLVGILSGIAKSQDNLSPRLFCCDSWLAKFPSKVRSFTHTFCIVELEACCLTGRHCVIYPDRGEWNIIMDGDAFRM